jgi:hypothetical protein
MRNVEAKENRSYDRQKSIEDRGDNQFKRGFKNGKKENGNEGFIEKAKQRLKRGEKGIFTVENGTRFPVRCKGLGQRFRIASDKRKEIYS